MEPLVNKETYTKRLNRLIYSYPITLFVGSFLLAILYNVLKQAIMPTGDALLSPKTLSEIFFQGTVVAVIMYLYKTRSIGGVVNIEPTSVTDKEVQAYLPVVVGTNPLKQKVAYLLVEEGTLALHVKKVNGYVCDMTWEDLSKIDVTYTRETFNLLMLFVYGFRESIQITDGTTSVSIIFPKANQSASEIKESIQGFIE